MSRPRRRIAAAITLCSALAAALAGCIAAPPDITEPSATFVPDEDAFLEAIADGFQDPDDVGTFDQEMLEAGYLGCEAVALGTSRDELLAQAEESVSGSPVFNASMPNLLVDAALTHLCSSP